MRTRVLIGALSVCALWVVGCVESTNQARIEQLQTRQATQDEEIARTELDVARLSASWSDVVERYRLVEREYRRAREYYEVVLDEAEAASEASLAARRDWRRAEEEWQLYRTIVLVAIAMEVGRYQEGSFSCDGMSTTAFRRLLISQGTNLMGMDIDHIVPRSLGGADHPMNYQVLRSSTNRSLGARWDASKCLMAGRGRCAEALAVSKKCGSYTGPWF